MTMTYRIETLRIRRGHKFYPRVAVPTLYAQDGKGLDAKVYAHYFVGGMDWYVTEYDDQTGEAFGWSEVLPGGGELGYFSLPELEGILVRGMFPVERDLYWDIMTLREALAERGR